MFFLNENAYDVIVFVTKLAGMAIIFLITIVYSFAYFFANNILLPYFIVKNEILIKGGFSLVRLATGTGTGKLSRRHALFDNFPFVQENFHVCLNFFPHADGKTE